MRRTQIAITTWSRETRPATDDWLRTAPVEWSVLSVVLSALVVPAHAECVDVALHRVGERDTIRRRMADVRQLQRLGIARIDSHCRRGRHIYEMRRGHRPVRAIVTELDRCGFHSEEFSDAVSYTHLRAHETDSYLVCRLLLEKKK